MNITNYKVVSQNAVPDMLRNGWQPYGFPTTFWAQGGFTKIVQTMVRYEQPPSPPSARRRDDATEFWLRRMERREALSTASQGDAESPTDSSAPHAWRLEKESAFSELLAENQRLREAVEWALGERGEFKPPTRRDDGLTDTRQPPYWWRDELRCRAGLDGPKP